jgi:glyoxylase-like metal-dependent hydrolase (beta-lactamase superfamily II)
MTAEPPAIGPTADGPTAFGPVAFEPVAAGVFVVRTRPLDVNVTLVLGDHAALVVDTLSTHAQAVALRDAVRRITALPITVANTHFHFDHCFGNDVLAEGGRPIWAHRECAAELRERGDAWRRRWADEWAARQPELAAALAAVAVRPADHEVTGTTTLDLGGRRVTLTHLGHGHTNGDIVVHVPDADVLVAGDLVEQGAPPDFADSHPLEWPATLSAMCRLLTDRTVVVPGHGARVDSEFVSALHEALSRLDWLIREGHQDGASVAEVLAQAPFPAEACRAGVERGFAALSATW